MGNRLCSEERNKLISLSGINLFFCNILVYYTGGMLTVCSIIAASAAIGY